MFQASTTSMRQVEGVMGVTVVREENQRRVAGDSLYSSSLCDERGTQSCGEMPLDERGTRRVSGDSLSRSSLCDERGTRRVSGDSLSRSSLCDERGTRFDGASRASSGV